MKKLLKKLFPCLLAITLVLSLTACGGSSSSGSSDSGSEKNITVVVTHKDGSATTQKAAVKADKLIDALDEMGLVDPTSGDDGYYTTVDGETADTDAEEWWCLTVDGESATTGFDDTPVEDGKSYEITFTQGW